MKAFRYYQKDLVAYLKDPKAAASYLNAALEDGDPRIFYIALRNVAEAQGNMTRFAKKCKISRANIYKMTSKQANPNLETVIKLIQCLGLHFKIATKPRSKLAAC